MQLVQHEPAYRKSRLIHLLRALLRLESIILLRKVAERDNDDRGQDLGNGGINMPLLYKQLDKNIVEKKTDQHQHKISPQLHPALQGRLGKDNITHQEEPRGKAHQKGDDDRGDMGFEYDKTQVEILLMQDKIVCNGIHKDIQQGVRPPAG